MTVTIFSNFFNHHQKPLADELYKRLGDKFTFVATIPMPESFKKSGYDPLANTPYVLNVYKSENMEKKAMELGWDSDVVIHGAAPLIYIIKRIESNKVTFRYSERIFKKSHFQKFNPRALWHQYKLHTQFRNKNLFMLCAGAFTANDLSWIRAYPEKMYKWGYFTKVEEIDIKSILEKKRLSKFKILYVARLIDWKHPEMAIFLGKMLKEKKYDFEINIVGSGTLESYLKRLISKHNLDEEVKMKGNIPNESVLQLMRQSHVYFFSSDRNEGWGAVANEAMANGCTLVGSHLIGSIPYLIKHGKNGLVFESENLDDAFRKIAMLIEDRNFCEKLAFHAYKNISEIWSPKQAAENFLRLTNSLLNHHTNNIIDGPCSKAYQTSINWNKK